MAANDKRIKHLFLGLAFSYPVLFPNLNTGLTLICVGVSIYAYTVALRNPK